MPELQSRLTPVKVVSRTFARPRRKNKRTAAPFRTRSGCEISGGWDHVRVPRQRVACILNGCDGPKAGPSTTCKGATQVSAFRTGTATPGSRYISFPGPGSILREGPISCASRFTSPGVELLPHLPFVSLKQRRRAARAGGSSREALLRRHPLHRMQAM